MRCFWISRDEKATFGEIDARSTRMAQCVGAARRPKRAIPSSRYSTTAKTTVLTLIAINKIGGIWVPINTAYRGEFLRHPIADANAALAVCESHYLENMLADH